MGAEVKPLREMVLSNGVVVRCYDCSRRLAGDRWYVCLRVEVPCPVDRSLLDDLDADAYERWVARCGPVYTFSFEKVRHFISEEKKDEVLEDLVHDVLHHSVPYLSHPSFQRQCVRKSYQRWVEEQRWRVLHEEAVRRADDGGE